MRIGADMLRKREMRQKERGKKVGGKVNIFESKIRLWLLDTGPAGDNERKAARDF
jgi:hypothetical protein